MAWTGPESTLQMGVGQGGGVERRREGHGADFLAVSEGTVGSERKYDSLDKLNMEGTTREEAVAHAAWITQTK